MFNEPLGVDEEVRIDELIRSLDSVENINKVNNQSLKPHHIEDDFEFTSPICNFPNRTMVVEEYSKYMYPSHATNSYDRENYTISTDHCYARPWNWRPDANFLRPAKILFGPKQKSSIKSRTINHVDDEIDIETVTDAAAPDWSKVRNVMDECEKYAFSSRTDKGEEDWDANISKIHWSPAQHRVFNSMVNILNNLNLAKLSQTDNTNEPIMRRTVIDKAVQRVRRLLSTVAWEPKITQWLHLLMIDHLGPHYLALYLDILQTLKAKLPMFVEKMMYGPNSTLRMGALNNVNLQPLLERTWDPMPVNMQDTKPKKLPGNPVFVVVPSAPMMNGGSTSGSGGTRSMQKWLKLLANLATVVTVPTNFGSAGHRMTMTSCLDQLFSVTKGTIQDVRADHPGRNIVLVGFRAGAALALQVARVESVLSVIAIGFSLLTAEGRRGEPDDSLLELQCPVLFVVGQRSNVSSQEDMEELRERMRVETGLIVVGCADDYLRVSKKRQRMGCFTQSIVDRCVVDEIGEFVSAIILSPYPPQIRQSPTTQQHLLLQASPESSTTTTPALSNSANAAMQYAASKKGKLLVDQHQQRKRYNSNASSLDSSEPPSPTPPRITRPVGRPPGSKSKSRLEAKWAQQIAQGSNNSGASQPVSPNPSPTPPIQQQHTTPSSSYPTLTSTTTPDTSSTEDSLSQPPDRQQPQLATAAPAAASSSSTTSSFQLQKASSLSDLLTQSLPTTTSVKKIKTLKPTTTTSTTASSSLSSNMLHDKPGLVLHGKSSSARMQAYGMNRSVIQDGNLSTLLQGGIKTIPPNTKLSNASGIKVLENVTLSANSTSKLLHNRSIDLSKITLINSIKTNTSSGNVILLPDGKFRTIHSGSNIKQSSSSTSTNSNGSIFMPMTQQKVGLHQRHNRNNSKLITTKRQLINQRPPLSVHHHNNKPIIKKSMTYSSSQIVIPTIQTTTTTLLPPPTNLTTQDIMDLPIIFADDDDQLLDTATPVGQSASTATTVVTTANKVITNIPQSATKFMLINKQVTSNSNSQSGNLILSSPTSTATINKKSTSSSPITTTTFSKPTPKYTKIILSTKKPLINEDNKGSSSTGFSSLTTSNQLQCLSPEITVKKVVPQKHQQYGAKTQRRIDGAASAKTSTTAKASSSSVVELVDLENEIKATAVPKPNMVIAGQSASSSCSSAGPTSDKNITIVQKNASGNYELVQMKQDPSLPTATIKKTIQIKYDMLAANNMIQKATPTISAAVTKDQTSTTTTVQSQNGKANVSAAQKRPLSDIEATSSEIAEADKMKEDEGVASKTMKLE